MEPKPVSFVVNGVQHRAEVGPDELLIDYLRDDLGLTGTKQSCDKKGQCGACMVVINGKAVLSCLEKLVDLQGATVTTVEGLGSPEKPHPIQEAFVLAEAVQCGFCTPGLVMTTKALLDQNPNPDVPAIKRALARNMCRCTGYKKVIDAVQLSSRFLAGETTPEEYRRSLSDSKIGVPHPRPTSILKACGAAKFSGDMKFEGMLELALVHSTQFHARIKSIDTSAALKMPGVAGVITGEDIKGTNRIRVFAADQPVLCEDVVRTLGDPVAAVAAETREQARAAAEAVRVEYEPLPVMMTPEEALAPSAYQLHKHSPNLCYAQPLLKGDPDTAFKESEVFVEAEFSTQMVHQAPMEPEAAAAYFVGNGEGGPQLVVVGRSINIHDHMAQIKEAIGYDNMRYQEAFAGGQFGIKASVTTEPVTAAAALHFKRPVRYVPTLEESMLITTKRHPYRQKVKLAADASGHLTALDYDATVNKGAYAILGPLILWRSIHMLQNSYNIPNIKASTRMVYTNAPAGGAARGAGPPQTAFAIESAMDMLAEKIGMDPLEFRKMNSLKPGQTKATGMVVDVWPFPELCDDIKPHYDRAKRDAATFNAKNRLVKHGVGLAPTAFGIAEAGDVSRMFVEMDPDDGITIFAAVADPGEGNDAMLTQIAAHELNLPLEKVRLYTRDTDKTVGTGFSAGSRMTWMAGNALLSAIGELKKAMGESGEKSYAGLKKAGKPFRYEGTYKAPGTPGLDPQTGKGDSFTSECHNIQMAEVEVDLTTGVVRVMKMTCVVDSGRVINPHSFEGQLEGGMDQGVGWALREEYVPGKTQDYVASKFPKINTYFDSEIIFRETPRPNGPLGATGIGETTMVSTAPAVVNAIYDACRVRIFDLPATPEKVKKALNASVK
jgi:aldehyde oxidoreductase